MKLKLFPYTFLTVCLAISGAKAAEAASLTTLATGLNNPVGLSFGTDGSLYVGETGIGGDGQCQPSPSTQFELICAGNTGSVTRVTLDGQQERVLDNLESLALENSKEQGAGPQQLSFDSSGNAYLVTGYAGNPGNRDLELNAFAQNIELPPGQAEYADTLPADEVLSTSTLGHLFQVDLNTGNLTEIADLSEYELLNNPDGGDYISNPFGFVIEGDTAYIADGGANVIFTAKLDGSSLTATPLPTQTIEDPVFPPVQPGSEPGSSVPPLEQLPEQVEIQSVPTGIDIGPDGAVYVGEYTGAPFPEGEAWLFRIGEDGEPEVFADGFTQITDIAFDENGNLLVLQLAEEPQWTYNDGNSILDLPSSLIQLAPDGTRTTLVAAGEGLLSATGLVIGTDNEIYVTNRGAGPGVGEVVRVDSFDVEAVPEPSSILGLLAFAASGTTAWFKRKGKAAN